MRPPFSTRLATRIALAAVIAIAPASCGDPSQVITPDEPSAASGLGGSSSISASQATGGGAGPGGGGGPDGDGGGPPPVWVGLVANARDDDPATNVDEVEAAVRTFAVGASVFATKRAWRAASDESFALDARLANAGCARAPCRPAALTLAIVDGRLDGRPDELVAEPWDGDAAMDAIATTVDAAMDALGPTLTFLAVGARVDRWIEAHEEDAESLERLLAFAVDRARSHPAARSDLLVGVGLSREGALAPSGHVRALRELGTATMASLFPGLNAAPDGTLVPSPGIIALDLDQIDDVDPGRPVGLVEVGYPSSALVGGSDEAQGLFLDALFEALASRRASFPLVVVSRLHDLEPQACAEEGAVLGEEDERVLAYRCSTGMLDDDGDPKPAWSSFVVGAAQLASGATGWAP